MRNTDSTALSPQSPQSSHDATSKVLATVTSVMFSGSLEAYTCSHVSNELPQLLNTYVPDT